MGVSVARVRLDALNILLRVAVVIHQIRPAMASTAGRVDRHLMIPNVKPVVKVDWFISGWPDCLEPKLGVKY
jgi:hypothetical protein